MAIEIYLIERYQITRRIYNEVRLFVHRIKIIPEVK